MTNTTNTSTDTTGTMSGIWSHIDQLHDDSGEQLMTVSIDSIEAVKAALMTGEIIDTEIFARLLGHAVIGLRAAREQWGHVVIELGELSLNQ